jgi:hypothetical protein
VRVDLPVQINFEQQPFPVVTICPLNPVKASVAADTFYSMFTVVASKSAMHVCKNTHRRIMLTIKSMTYGMRTCYVTGVEAESSGRLRIKPPPSYIPI